MCKAVIYSPCSPALGGTVRTHNCSSMWMSWQVWTGLSLLIPGESLVCWRWCWPWVALFKNLFLGWVATHLTLDFERCIFIVVVVIIYFKPLPAMRGWLSKSLLIVDLNYSSITWDFFFRFSYSFKLFNFSVFSVVVRGGVELDVYAGSALWFSVQKNLGEFEV